MRASYDELSKKYLEYVTLNNWAKTFPTTDNILAAKNALFRNTVEHNDMLDFTYSDNLKPNF